MKKLALGVVITALLAACAAPRDPWFGVASSAAVVSSAEPTPILTLAASPVECEGRPAPTISIVQAPALGAVFVEAGERLIDPEGLACPEDALQPTTTVFYEATAPGPAIDSLILRETAGAALVERDHAIQVRIR